MLTTILLILAGLLALGIVGPLLIYLVYVVGMLLIVRRMAKD